MRLDRLLTLYCFHPLRKILRQNSDLRIPILMYHSVSDRDADVSHAYYQTNTRPEIFSRQMQFLADNNYKVITLTEAIDLISGHSLSPGSLPVTGHRSPVTEAPRYAVLTFDDGYRDFYDNAFPVTVQLWFSFAPSFCRQVLLIMIVRYLKVENV